MSHANGAHNGEQRLRDLSSHLALYVTVDDLARYWLVSRKQIYKRIEEGKLPAIRLGPRSWRIRTSDAMEFEARSIIEPLENERKIRAVTPNDWPLRRRDSERRVKPEENLMSAVPRPMPCGTSSNPTTTNVGKRW